MTIAVTGRPSTARSSASICAGVVGARIDHGEIARADQVGLGARIGESGRIGREHPRNERFELLSHAGRLLPHAGEMAVCESERKGGGR